mgnify:CR=1 FL=1
MILKFSFGIIFSITFLGLGNSILLSIKITPKKISKTKVQKTFPYQAKCLKWIKEEFHDLSEDNKSRVRTYLDGTGCGLILE